MIRFENLMNMPLQPFVKELSCYPVIMMNGKERKELDRGGKIILPASALDHLTRLHIEFPMLFRLTNKKAKDRITHCGVLEFVAEEGRCYLPYWMMKNLMVKEGEVIKVEYVKLPIAMFAKFQPQSVDFLDISNPKAVLENTLRNYATLTQGDVISIHYNDKDYEVCILETRPGNAVSIIECDIDVDFAPPVGYQEPEKTHKPSNARTRPGVQPKEKPPVNIGYRLDGKAHKIDPSTSASAAGAESNQADANSGKRGLPDYDYKFGSLRLNQIIESNEPDKAGEPVKEVKGYKLKHIGVK